MFSLMFWVRPESSGHLFIISDESLSFSIDGVLLKTEESPSIVGNVIPGEEPDYEVLMEVWQCLGVRVDRSEVYFHINGGQINRFGRSSGRYIDNPEYYNRVGVDYTGFIYKFCIYQYLYSEFITEFPPNCPIDQTFDESTDTCEDCKDLCDSGCIRTTDCRLCTDPNFMCRECPTYGGNCEEDGCIERAVNLDGICECQVPNYYQVDIDVCDLCVVNGCA